MLLHLIINQTKQMKMQIHLPHSQQLSKLKLKYVKYSMIALETMRWYYHSSMNYMI